MTKLIFTILWIGGILGFIVSPLGASVLSGIRYLGINISSNLSGIMTPEIGVFFTISLFMLGLAVYSVFSKN